MTLLKADNKIIVNRLTDKVIRQNWSVGGGLLTDSVNDYVTFGNILNYNISDPFSFSFILYTTDFSLDGAVARSVIAKYNGTKGFRIRTYSTNRIDIYYIKDTSNTLSVYSIGGIANVFQHIVITKGVTLNSTKIYINGIQQNTSTTGSGTVTDILTTYPLILYKAQYNLDTGRYKGYLHGLKIFNVELTSDEVYKLFITKNQVIPSTCSSYLQLDCRFDDKSGTLLKDRSNNAYHGVLTNFASGTTDLGANNSWVDQYNNPITQY